MRLLPLVCVVLCCFGSAVASAQTTAPVLCNVAEETCETLGTNPLDEPESEADLTVYDDVKATTDGREALPTESERDWLNSQSFGSDSLFDITR